jgi:NADPH:quinone reductase-like Zn-dependent oxidoreductase
MARIVRVHHFGGAPHVEEIPDPVPGPGEVLVDVIACGVNPSDWKRVSGGLRHVVRELYPITLGSECSGVVAATGAGVRCIAPGDEVFGVHLRGAFATRIVAPAATLVLKPRSISHYAASAVPVAALTAYQALHVHAAVKPGDRVLVHGAAGGVGGFAIQLARIAGAQVSATASGTHRDYVLGLGASRFIDYERERFEQILREVDLVIDGVGGDVEQRSLPILHPRGRLLSLNPPAPDVPACTKNDRVTFFRMRPDRQQLTLIASLLGSNRLRVEVRRTLPLTGVRDALSEISSGRGRGKIVLDARA